MEQNREPRNRLTQKYPNDFLTKVWKQYNGGRIAFLTSGAGASGHAKAKKSELWTKPHTFYGN